MKVGARVRCTSLMGGIWLSLIAVTPCAAETSVAVLDFELNDLTLQPGTPEESARTASIRPLLEQALGRAEGVRLVNIEPTAVTQANAGLGYLFEHPEVAADLGREHQADWVLVGRLHKPSFLFAYLMARLVDTHTGAIGGDYIVEVKGPQGLVTAKGVERLAEKVLSRIAPGLRSRIGKKHASTRSGTDTLYQVHKGPD
jgi:hypothetical protein